MKNILIEEIKIENINNKSWLVVYFENNTRWVPALIEQGKMAQDVANCEKSKYQNLSWDAEKMPADFIKRAINGENICALAFEFKLTHTRAYKKFCLRKNNDDKKES